VISPDIDPRLQAAIDDRDQALTEKFLAMQRAKAMESTLRVFVELLETAGTPDQDAWIRRCAHAFIDAKLLLGVSL
jgi:hypothetical protein